MALSMGGADSDISSMLNYMSFNLDAGNAWYAGDLEKA
jgi:hypothetical protein